ncbi:hypothetical protein N7456_007175 [Penicillium angulare]|uniref:Mpv17/PMP22 n=1 Tax=Penicillium angulare TaxID=116970 RepID=A0A9W9FJ08_9EURO|nr:hypothetical protein N7456_007175 [Penicillium angulare]
MLSPLTVTFVQSTVLNALSNLLAQLIDQWNSPSQSPFKLNTLALLQFITYGILIVPINFYWQRALEARYPGFPTRADLKVTCSPRKCSLKNIFSFFSSSSTDILPSHKEKEKDKEKWAPAPRSKPVSGLHSFIMKFIFDLTLAGMMNIVLFIVLINFLKGEGLKRVWDLVIEDFRPIMIARLKYRPVVSTLMYTVIPVDRRVVFGSACGVIWGIYLSLYAVV